MLNEELLAKAAQDPYLGHAAVRLLLLLQTTERPKSNPWSEYAKKLGVLNASPFRKQLIDNGYLEAPSNAHQFKPRQQEASYDSKTETAHLPVGT